MPSVNLIEAITQAMAYELRADPSVLVLGEDVGVNGGVFRATAGLHQQFGAARVIDTPLDDHDCGRQCGYGQPGFETDR
jgi:2-oxoisovalerate dehydrogenase E1 component beta subunit